MLIFSTQLGIIAASRELSWTKSCAFAKKKTADTWKILRLHQDCAIAHLQDCTIVGLHTRRITELHIWQDAARDSWIATKLQQKQKLIPIVTMNQISTRKVEMVTLTIVASIRCQQYAPAWYLWYTQAIFLQHRCHNILAQSPTLSNNPKNLTNYLICTDTIILDGLDETDMIQEFYRIRQ